MFKFGFLVALVLPLSASAADYVVSEHRAVSCPLQQSGSRYCVVVPPVEKLITDCDPGVDCHHMQSGQHYSVQSPVTFE
jgi:hypothetical protein